jgi:hypothetical protein
MGGNDGRSSRSRDLASCTRNRALDCRGKPDGVDDRAPGIRAELGERRVGRGFPVGSTGNSEPSHKITDGSEKRGRLWQAGWVWLRRVENSDARRGKQTRARTGVPSVQW